MASSDQSPAVRNNKDENRFEIDNGGDVALLEYTISDGRIALTHTEVPPDMEGKGFAGALAKSALNFAREQGLEVLPFCSFVATYIRRHKEYGNLVPSDFNG